MRFIWQLAWRLRTGNKQQGFARFISASSTMGIGLGCFVLILLLSVMNGFEKELKERLLAVIPHGELTAVNAQGINDWQQLLEEMSAHPYVVRAEAFSQATGMVQVAGSMKAVSVTGLDASQLAASPFKRALQTAQLTAFNANPKGVLLGRGILKNLQLRVGDKVQLLLPQTSSDMRLKPPKTQMLTVVGEIAIGGEPDNHLAVMHLATLSQILAVQNGAQGIRLYYRDPFQAASLTRELGYSLEQPLYLSSWFRTQGHLYQDIQLVRTVVYLALVLLIAVACFNIVSTLVMAVNDKSSEIAMLKTLGATDQQIIQVFILLGMSNGLIGTVLGVVSGAVVATHIGTIAKTLENVLGQPFLSGDIYFIDFLPSQLYWSEVGLTALIALVLSFLATLYPARQAAAINPARVLG